MNHTVSIRPVEPATAPWPRASAVCLNCGWSAYGKALTVSACALDHATEDHS